MDKVLDGLWIGSLVSANDCDLLKSIGITTVLSVGCTPNLSGEIENLCFPDILDSPEAIILHILPQTNNFLAENIRAGRNCLVHCVYGQSRSATVCVAFMLSIGRSLENAIEQLKLCHPNICINPGFLSQLYIYAHPKYTAECEVVICTAMRLAHGQIIIPARNEPHEPQLTGFAKCRFCNEILSDGFNFLKSFSENADDVKIFLGTYVDGFWKGYMPMHTYSPLVHSSDRFYLLQPLMWMRTQIEDFMLKGEEQPREEFDLFCPGCKRPCGCWKFDAFCLCSGFVVCDAYVLWDKAIAIDEIDGFELFPASLSGDHRTKNKSHKKRKKLEANDH